jgi:ethanolamine utilization protein EutN
MRIGEVIGRVTLSQVHPSLRNARWLIARPLTFEAIVEGSPRRGEGIVVFDQSGAGPGSLIAISEGRDAANPFGKDRKPVDAYCACLIDRIHA